MPVPAGTRTFRPVTGTPAGKRTSPASGAGATRAPTACARPRWASSAWSAWARARGAPARPRTTFGGRPVAGAVVTWTLVAINVAVFLVAWVRPGIVNDLEMLGYARYTAGGPLHGVAAGEWYRLITSAFVVPAAGLSGLGFMDILFNMWALVFVGPALEGLLGRVRFLAVYLLSAVGGAVMYYYLVPPDHRAAGASGAIFGLFGAWFVVSRRLRLDTRGIVVLIAINLALSFFFHSFIAWQDHIGGLLTGALLTAAYAYAPRKNRAAVQVAATVAVVALIVVAVVIRNGQLTSGAF